MADLNSTPRTWVASEFVTETLMNTEIRDALTNLQSAWTAYTPVWTGSTTNPTLGNGVWDCAYRRIGKTILYRISLTMGSTTTYGTGNWSISLPFNPKTDRTRSSGGVAYDTSAVLHYDLSSIWLLGSTTNLLAGPGTSAGGADRTITSAAPFTWAVGDILTLNGAYEAV